MPNLTFKFNASIITPGARARVGREGWPPQSFEFLVEESIFQASWPAAHETLGTINPDS